MTADELREQWEVLLERMYKRFKDELEKAP